ncbi:hypothetical protein GCU60_13880 [Blastococcus saxobsidens]|uniref:DivIVA domain-containing protein n=1 Tax=Blastococcus saxobsidens TaxID=138336 RepID=A0A6L9W4X0_9ACTN|nr:hypothetical protein [Blastococcus saxobsidens]NEK86832.1 hypothetical protein [Blastococcus saxobsidens]
MTVQLAADAQAGAALADPTGTTPDTRADGDRRRPNVSGDLPTLFDVGPQFRRAVTGYDRFQVDTYVRWAEDELVAADREREHLEVRLLRVSSELRDAQRLLGHSPGGGQFLAVADRIGSLLATAADEAEGLRAEAAACRAAATTEAEQLLACAARTIAEAEDRSRETVEAATAQADALTAGARAVVTEAERAAAQLRSEAAGELAAARATGEQARGDAEGIRRAAAEDALAARQRARQEVVGMLTAAREERRRADEEAAAFRQRREDDAALRSAAVLAEVDVLRTWRSALDSEVQDLVSRRSALQAEVRRLEQGRSAAGALWPARLRARLRSWSGTPRTH